MVVVTALLVVIGIAGTLLPILPGIPLVWAGIVLYGIIEGFGTVGWVATSVVTVVGAVGIYLAFRIPQRAAAEGAIGWWGQLLALGLAIVGFFAVPVVGAAIGFVLGVYLAALLRDRPRAWAATAAAIKALFIASGLQFAAATTMAITWVIWVVAV